ncbi:adenosylcobinamide-GDP ribazoletransferase [Vibrio salinus]|uniref:adenosylcobinamide-GDP ribazoletransferase n=1 Tax=Vibrio salinus TaxID=2899784 RepID=UPI001E4E3952|nr:adenosylcobinamide-GDP ribazoletransferase [Vibrio salinus]MCE0495674.1 adenosylcobinamide-GDP ribazoletransferase [Vibrio salinus]
MKLFLAMLQFMSRLPIPYRWTEDLDFSKSYKGIIWFPMVGAVIGIISAYVFHCFYAVLGTGPWVSAAIYVSFLAVMTGGLHLDGLADTCDGIFSARKRERMLEIMKDSRIGTHGVLALFFVLMIKIFVVAQFAISGDMGYMAVLFSAPIASRTLMSVLMYGQKYAREEGLGNIFIGKIAKMDYCWCLLMGAAFCILATGTVLPFVGTAVFAYWFRHYINHLLGGHTGDTLGAGNELFEVVFLLLFLVNS